MKANTTIPKAKKLIKQLSGSVSVPKDKKGANLDQIILQAKQKHFCRMSQERNQNKKPG